MFGLGTLIFNGLEIAMHATMNNKSCVDDIVIAHPILQVRGMVVTVTLRSLLTQALFTFLQMHFLFVNCTVIVERFGLFARYNQIILIEVMYMTSSLLSGLSLEYLWRRRRLPDLTASRAYSLGPEHPPNLAWAAGGQWTGDKPNHVSRSETLSM